jgi:hypothetical protein
MMRRIVDRVLNWNPRLNVHIREHRSVVASDPGIGTSQPVAARESDLPLLSWPTFSTVC